jgi:uncharacterized protein
MLTVSRLSITPVRGTRLHHPDAVRVDRHGVTDDRRYLILDPDDRIFDGTKLGPLVQLTAELRHDPEQLSIAFPDGSIAEGEVELGAPMTITVYSRSFLVRPVIGPWADALSAWAGRPLRLARVERTDGAFDRNPVSIVSRASVEELGRHVEPPGAVDARRFRMLVEVDGASPHQEDEWLGHEVGIGEAVVRVTKRDPRCVITTQDPDTGLRDIPTLHVIKAYRGLREGKHLDFGVYADVVRPGEIRVGDAVTVRSPG